MKRGLLFSFLLVACMFVQAQSERVSDAVGDYISCDIRGNIYVVNGASLVKLDPFGSKVANYEDFLLGDISSIDSDNPLKIMLFYRDAGKIVFLDDRLTVIGEPLDLFSQNLQNVTLATYSTDNKIWLYDEVAKDLIAVDFHLNVISRNHLTISGLNPSQFLSLQEKKLVLVNTDAVLFFDAFGTYLNSYPVVSDTPIQVVGDRIYYTHDGIMMFYLCSQLWGSSLVFHSGTRQVLATSDYYYYLDKDRQLYRHTVYIQVK